MGSFLFVNPASGSYASKRIPEIVAALRTAGRTMTIYTVRTPLDVRACCNIMYTSDTSPDVIVAAGDGTVNAVLNCLIPDTATLAVLPLGTSNVLAAELGIHSLADGVQRIIRGASRSLTVGQLDLNDATYRFSLMAGIGLDGAVVRDVRDDEKRILRQGAYLVSALKNCLAWETETSEVITTSQTLNCHTVVVCNASRYGGDFVLAPESSLFSPGFMVACIQGRQRSTYLGAAFDLVRGNAAASRYIHQIACHEVEIRGNRPIQIDGDFVGYGPARLKTVSDVCRIVV